MKLIKSDRTSLLASQWSELPSYLTHMFPSLAWAYHCGQSDAPHHADLLPHSFQCPRSWGPETTGRALFPPKYPFPILCHSGACEASKCLGQDGPHKSQWRQAEGLRGGQLRFPEVRSQKFDPDWDKQEVCKPSEGLARNRSSGAKTGEVRESRKLGCPPVHHKQAEHTRLSTGASF